MVARDVLASCQYFIVRQQWRYGGDAGSTLPSLAETFPSSSGTGAEALLSAAHSAAVLNR